MYTWAQKSTCIFNRFLTGLPTTSLAWGREWHRDKEAQSLSSVVVYSSNVPCLLSTPSTTYSCLVFKKKILIYCVLNKLTLVALMHLVIYSNHSLFLKTLCNTSYPCIIQKTSIWSRRILLVSRVVNLHC